MKVVIGILATLIPPALVLWQFSNHLEKRRFAVYGLALLVTGGTIFIINIVYPIPILGMRFGVEPTLAPIEATSFIVNFLLVSGIICLLFSWAKKEFE